MKLTIATASRVAVLAALFGCSSEGANPGAGGQAGASSGGASSAGSGGSSLGGVGPGPGGAGSSSGMASSGSSLGGSAGAAVGGASGGSAVGGSAGGPASGGSSAGAGAASGLGGAGLTGGAGGGTAGSSSVGGAPGSGGGTAGNGGAAGGGDVAVPLDPSLLSKCTGSAPITCAINVPNGNHTVTVELGDATAASTSRVQSELFRISVPQTQLAAGMFSKHTFSVNVRDERHDGYTAQGGILNLLIDGPAPRLRGLGVAPAPSAITIFIASDSTACDWDPQASNVSSTLQRGWGQELTQFLKPAVAVANYADSGESSGGFYGKFWGPAKAALKMNDYVFIQFGHNDSSTGAAAYRTNLLRYINDAKAVGAIPVVFTPVSRKGSATFNGLDGVARTLAMEQNLTLIDLMALSRAHYDKQTNVVELFASSSDGTHFSELGATQIAKLVTDAIKATSLPLKAHIR